MHQPEDAGAPRSAPQPPVHPWRAEPFRTFFPLGVLLAWVGIGHWILYDVGFSATYSCVMHGFVQMQAFMMAFAVGFLLTALPRRTHSAAASALELWAAAVLLVTTTAAALAEDWVVAELAYAGIFLLLLQFALRRFVGGRAGRRPPASFVLVPIAMFHGLAGAALMIAATRHGAAAWTTRLGRLLIEQGVFLCLAVGIGSLVLPLIGGRPPPADLGSSPRESWRVRAYAAAGAAVFLSCVLEAAGWSRFGPLLRAAVVAAGLGMAGAARLPGKPGAHRRLVWLSVWLMPTGLLVSALAPDYRVPALHILFIGGFSLMAFGVATHVALSHLDLPELAAGNPRPVIAFGAAFLLALAARLAADMSHTYFDHLAWAAGMWIAGSVVWIVFFGPRLLRR
jgi:uncharacterized protein involved in response to NO